MTNLTALKLLIASSLCVLVTSFSIPEGFGDFGNSNANSRTTLNCATLGCVDCHEWCPRVKYMCARIGKTYCRKTCQACTNTHPLCVEKQCDHMCKMSADQSSAKCSCYPGYKLVNGNKCEEITECDTPDLCTDPKKPFCNEYGNSYTCSGCDSAKGLSPFYERAEGCCNVNAAETCGDSKNIGSAAGRIQGGKNAKVGYWPWQAYLEFPDSLCGGSLISDQWVLTAAHCLANGNPTTVMFGVLNISDSTNAHTQSFDVVKSVIHPDYKYPYNDIALLKIDRKPVQSIFAKPVCMPGGEKPAEGTRCYVTGFGTLESRGKLAAHLQEVDVPIANMEKCRKNYNGVNVSIDSDSMLCAGYDEGGKDACQGDSGGPLVCQRCSSCNWYIAGVVSFGKGCAMAKYYGVYANVVHFEDWVSKQIQETIPKSASCDDVKGTWGEWSAEGTCSAPCGGGQIKMTRSCSEWGACTGDSVRFDTCNEGLSRAVRTLDGQPFSK